MGNTAGSKGVSNDAKLKIKTIVALSNRVTLANDHLPHSSGLLRLTLNIEDEGPNYIYLLINCDSSVSATQIGIPQHITKYLNLKEEERNFSFISFDKIRKREAKKIKVSILNTQLNQPIDKTTFTDAFTQIFNEDPLCPGLPLLTKYDGKNVELVITDIDPPCESTIYYIGRQTEIEFTIDPRCSLKWIEHFGRQSIPLDFPNVGGYQEEKNQIMKIFLPRAVPETARKNGMIGPKSVLLYGPPKTGKNSLVTGIANFGLIPSDNIIIFNGSDVDTKVQLTFSDIEQKLAADNNQSSLFLIIFKKIDTFNNQKLIESYLNFLSSKSNVVIFATSNSITPTGLYIGYFETKILIGLPNAKYRLDILRVHTQKLRDNNTLDKEVSLEKWAERLEAYSGGEIKAWIEIAYQRYLEENYYHLEHGNNLRAKQDISFLEKNCFLTNKHLEAAFETIKPDFGLDRTRFNFDAKNFAEYDKLKLMVNKFNETYNILNKSQHQRQINILISGEEGVGKTQFAKYLADMTKIKNICLITIEDLLGKESKDKINYINDQIAHALQTDMSIIIIDGLDNILKANHDNFDLTAKIESLLAMKEKINNKCTVLVTVRQETSFSTELRNVFNLKFRLDKFQIKDRATAAQIFEPICKVLGYTLIDNGGKATFHIDTTIKNLWRWIDDFATHNSTTVIDLDSFSAYLNEREAKQQTYELVTFFGKGGNKITSPPNVERTASYIVG